MRSKFLDYKKRVYLSLLGVILAILASAACAAAAPDQPAGSEGQPTTAAPGMSSPTQAPPTTAASMESLSGLSGDIAIDGSSTVFPITEAVAEEFGLLTSGKVRVTVGISGTGGGFEKFCRGETQIADASRPIKASEVELCQQAGIEFIEIPVAIDGLTVMVNPDNDFVSCITVEELHTIWGPEAEGVVTRWNQVRPEWPDEKIDMYAPGVDSGTFDYFTETINGESQSSRGDFTASEDDNILVQGIAGDEYSLGYFGYAYYVENTDKLKALAIDGGEGCVTPSDETINNGTYAPLSRPLFIYVRQDAAETPHVREFINYYLSPEGRQLAAEVGYIPFPDEIYDLALARFQNGDSGTLFGGDTPMKGPVADVLRGS
jgi:phosphate transport system substrate-binding protein